MKKLRLCPIGNEITIQKTTAPLFLLELQRGLLLELRERGLLNDIGYREAEEQLRGQFRRYRGTDQ